MCREAGEEPVVCPPLPRETVPATGPAEGDIAGAIMHTKKLAKLRRLLTELRSNPIGIKPRQLKSIARQLGRSKKSGFTNEPTFVRQLDPSLSPPLSIPAHKELKRGTARSIIDALLDDVDSWEQHIMEHGEGDDTDDTDDAVDDEPDDD